MPPETPNDDLCVQIELRDGRIVSENEIVTAFRKFKAGDVLKIHASTMGMDGIPGALSNGVLCRISTIELDRGAQTHFVAVSPIAGGIAFQQKRFNALAFIKLHLERKIVKTGANLLCREGHSRF